ncbi:MAG: hypothetical protein JXB62_21180 [Pirellulales bacterium]|nr:hypothetical protein [Pirellulales bacterium]
MIRVTCPECQSKLNAKDELAGQTRNCPSCGSAVTIPSPPKPTPLASGVTARPSEVAALLELDLPKQLDRMNRYLICDAGRMVAWWENNGHGWMLRTSAGLIPARRNPEQLPNRGDFKLVELKLIQTETGLRLVGLTSYQLAAQWALTTLDKGDDKILARITGAGHLSREQKNVVRQAIRDQLMHPVWTDADRVLQYLASADYHSSGTE